MKLGEEHSLLLYGGPGSNKSVLRKIAENYKYYPISTGELLREVNGRDPVISRIMQNGDLVKDKFVLGLVSKKIIGVKPGPKIVFDGVPRTVDQARLLIDMIKSTYQHPIIAISLEISADVAISRLLKRRRKDDSFGKEELDLDLIKKRRYAYDLHHKMLTKYLDHHCDFFTAVDVSPSNMAEVEGWLERVFSRGVI